MGDMSRALEKDVSRAAFRRLLQRGAPARVSELAADLGRPAEEIVAAVEGLNNEGRIRLDREGRVVGAAGLSIGPDRHRIDIGDRTFWTWCAYDVLGIFGALRASGAAHSTSPHSGESLEVHFRHGRPEPTTLVVFRPDDAFKSCCANVYEQWCPNSNFFESRQAASTWSKAHGMNGRVLGLTEAAELATANWEPLADGLRP
jgi:alkylmercury lyase